MALPKTQDDQNQLENGWRFPLPPLLGVPVGFPTGELPSLVPLVRGIAQVPVNSSSSQSFKIRELGGPVGEIGYQ
jgi:hypothetical protein